MGDTPASTTSDPPPSRANVLLVDDQPGNLLALEAVLEDPDRIIVRASSGEEALRRLLERDFAVVLLDVRMPGLDGFETARLIRGRGRSRATPIIFLTAHDDDGLSVEQAYSLGAVDYLVKPVPPVVMRAKVAGFIDLFLKTEQVRRQADQLLRVERGGFERSLAEENARLRASEERLRLVVESATGYAIFTLNTKGVIDGWNAGAERLFGYSGAEIVGQHDRILYTPEDAAQKIPEREMTKAGAEGRAVNERWHVRKDGGRFWGSGLVQPLRDGRNVVGFLKIMRDMTDQREYEERLRQSEETLAALVERCPFGIYIVDDEFRIASMNEGSQKGAFANVRPVIGRPFDEAMRVLWPEPVAAAVIDHFRHTLDTGEPYSSRDFVNPRADIGQTEGYEWELHRVTLPRGRHGVVCYYYDSTRLRQAERELKEADRKKDEFLATLAHELRNPLAPLRNGIQIMKLAGAAGAVEKSRAMMERQIGQMAHLIDDLMDLSRISRGKIVLQKTRLRVAEAVQDAVDTSLPLIEERGHNLVLDVPPEPLYVDADRTRLAQVFGNLLNNAAKYTEKGGRIRVAAERQGGDVVVAVEDNGVGIPAHMLNTVFDMFAQVDRSLEKSQGGLGIGLNIVKRLVEMHDGGIVAESGGHGAGSRFVVSLPVVLTVTTDKTDDHNEVSKAKPARRRILVVDDSRDGATSLAEMLDIMGNDTQTAFDGAEAVAVAEAFKPDVILMDIGMPKLNGYEACRRIRELPWGRNVVIVAQTGWGQEDDKRKSQEAGFDFHMIKPVDPAALDKILAELKATTG